MSHDTHIMNESRDIHKWVMAHICTSHGTCMNELCHMWHDSMMWCITYLCRTCNAAPWFMEMCAPWLIHKWAITHIYMCHDSFIYVPWLIDVMYDIPLPHMKHCTMTHSYMCRDSFIYVPWLVHICAMTHRCNVWHTFVAHASLHHDSFICVPWLIRMCAMTHRCNIWHTFIAHESLHAHGINGILSEVLQFDTH